MSELFSGRRREGTTSPIPSGGGTRQSLMLTVRTIVCGGIITAAQW